MTLQAMRYFVTAAQCRNFTRAAAQCFVSQPALSKAIAELEEEMGCPLFVRGNRSVKLTAEGVNFYKEAVAILLRADTLAERIKQKDSTVTITVSYHIYGHFDIFAEKVREAEKYLTRIEINPQYNESPPDIVTKLKERTTDMALLVEPSLHGLPPYEAVKLEHCWLCAIVPLDNPLSKSDSLTMVDLAEERFILFDEYKYSNLNNVMKNACLDAGYNMKIAGIANRVPEMVYAAIKKNAIGCCHSVAAYSDLPGVRFVPLSDMSKGFDLMAVRLMDSENRYVEALFSALKS